MKLSASDILKLRGVHPDLVKIVNELARITTIEFTILEGLRTVERQKQLVASGASTTMKSRHITGHAVDIAPKLNGAISWDWPLYRKLAPIIKQAAKNVNVPIEWGGDWVKFKDGPHWQLPWAKYK